MARLRQLILVQNILKHQRAVRQQAGGESGAAGCGHAHAVAVFVGDFRPTHLLMVASLLRQQVRRAILGSGTGEDAQLGAVQTVGIGFLRSQTVETQAVVLLGQDPFETKCRQRGGIRLARVLDRQVHAQCGVDFIVHGDWRVLGVGQFIAVGGLQSLAIGSLLDRRIGHTGIASGGHPLGALETGTVTAIIVGQRTEGGQVRAANHHFAAIALEGDHATLRLGEQHFAEVGVNTGVKAIGCHFGIAGNNGIRGTIIERNRGDILAEGQLVAGRSPVSGLSQTLVDFVGHFGAAGQSHQIGDLREGDRLTHGLAGRHIEAVVGMPTLHTVHQHARGEQAGGSGDKQVVVSDGHTGLVRHELHIGIQLLDFLSLGGGGAIGEHDAIAAELVIVRTVFEVAAVGQALGAVAAVLPQGLIDVIPDEAALVERVALQFGVQVQAAGGVAHRVAVFAGNVRLLAVLAEV